jgi:hypothetical protein
MKRNTFLYFGAALLALSSPALAQGKANYADCKQGGCTCVLAHVDLNDYAVATGTPAPKGAENMTLVAFEGAYYWSSSPIEDLDIAVGGDGICTPQLFDITPEDGIWTGSVAVTSITECHPQVAQMVPPLVATMSQTQRIVWGGSFDPAKLAKGGTSPDVIWTQVRPDYFTGKVPMAANGVIDISVDATATLTAPDRVAATLSIRFAPVSGENAGALGLIGMNGCETNAAYDFRRTGP